MKNHLKQIKLASFFAASMISAVFAAPTLYAADAAIFLSPITGTYTTGTEFTIAVMVGSGGESINAVEGKLEYNPKELEVVSINKDASILTSWTIAPSFSNETGEISFGGLLATGTVLTRGEVLKFNVKALRTGELHMRFASGAAVHAADGTGGNILSQLSGGVYVTKPNESEPTLPSDDAAVEAAGAAGEVLGAATGTTLTSSTHPDQDSWYATGTAVLNWSLPVGTQSILLALDKRMGGEGGNAYPPTVHERVIRDIKDGVWYFHLTQIMKDGKKETLSHRIAVDTVAPTALTISEISRENASDPNVKVILSATDTLSGVDHYAFALDELPETTWVDDGTHIYTLSSTPVGTHQLSVFAVDKAGNRTPSHLEFVVEHLPTPSLTIMNAAFIEGDTLKLNITSVPNAKLDIYIARANTSPTTEEFTVDGSGRGIFDSALPLSPGSFTVSAVARSANGALSKENDPTSFEVNSSFLGVMKRHPMIPIALIGLLLLLGLSWYFWKDMFGSSDEVESEEEVQTVSATPKTNTPSRVVAPGAVILGKRKN